MILGLLPSKGKKSPANPHGYWTFWRRVRDSNPRSLSGHSISNVLCDMESVRKEQKIMQEKLLYLQVKSELKAAKSGKKPWVRIGFKNGSKKAKKRELGENGENSGENKTPFPAYFSGTLKILLERTFTPFFCCWPKSAKRCKWWLQKNIATRFCSNTPNT